MTTGLAIKTANTTMDCYQLLKMIKLKRNQLTQIEYNEIISKLSTKLNQNTLIALLTKYSPDLIKWTEYKSKLVNFFNDNGIKFELTHSNNYFNVPDQLLTVGVLADYHNDEEEIERLCWLTNGFEHDNNYHHVCQFWQSEFDNKWLQVKDCILKNLGYYEKIIDTTALTYEFHNTQLTQIENFITENSLFEYKPYDVCVSLSLDNELIACMTIEGEKIQCIVEKMGIKVKNMIDLFYQTLLVIEDEDNYVNDVAEKVVTLDYLYYEVERRLTNFNFIKNYFEPIKPHSLSELGKTMNLNYALYKFGE